ncbi:MAG: right-handed parallel beta-helix repeat-containing protein [bacterium]
MESITPSTLGPTNTTSVDFAVVFSEDVTGFDAAGDVVVEVTGTVSYSAVTVTGSGLSYTVMVSGLEGDGGLALEVNAAVAQDAAGNANSAGGPSLEVQVDHTAPQVSSITRFDPNPTSATMVSFLVAFDSDVVGVETSDFALISTGLNGASIMSVSGAGNLYGVTVSTGWGYGSLRLDVPTSATIQDEAGNSLANLPYIGDESYSVEERLTIHIPGDYPTIQQGIDAAMSGDIVLVDAGTYVENVVMKDGVALIGSGAGVSIIDGSSIGSTIYASGVTAIIEGFTIINGSIFGIQLWDSSAVVVQRNIVKNNSHGIGLSGGSNLIQNNFIFDNTGRAIADQGGSHSILNNTIDHNGTGYLVGNGTSPAIRNNIFTKNGTGIDQPYSGVATLSYNDVWGNGINYRGCAPGAGDFSADPLFVNKAAGNYHLLEGSPCIDAGTSEGAPVDDIDGGPRPVGSGYDVGADEWHPISLILSPPTCQYVTTQRFDLALIVEAEGFPVTLAQINAKLDGADISAVLASRLISGTLVSGGLTLRYPALSGRILGTGTHVLEVTVYLTDGSIASETITWEVKGNAEPASPAILNGAGNLFVNRPYTAGAGLTIHVPGDFPTIQQGIDAAISGDTVLVAPGTYTENVIMKDGVALIGSGAGVSTIDGSGSGSTVFASGVTASIEGFTIINGSTFGIQLWNSSAVTVQKNIIRNNFRGIGLSGGSNTIQNNFIFDNTNAAIYDLVGNHSTLNNTIDHNGIGYRVGTGSSSTVTNNIITHNATGIDQTASGVVALSHNDVWGNGMDYRGRAPGASDLSLDPSYLAEAADNYHLVEGSPCIDTGTSAGAPADDFDGHTRPIGSGYDIGADEWHPISLALSPPTGQYVTTQRFDLALIVEVAGFPAALADIKAKLDGSDVSAVLASRLISGTLASGGLTLRYPALSGKILGAGAHILEVTVHLTDGSSASQTVAWEVKANTEP